MSIVYFNGEFIPYDQAVVPVEDRGHVFGDGIYEVVRFYDGKPLELVAHFERLARSAAAIKLELPPVAELMQAGLETVSRNELGDATLYMQVTRGSAPRKHVFPQKSEPSVFAIARPFPRPSAEMVRDGVACITAPDIRWHRCDIKSIMLLPNLLAKQDAVEKGAHEAIFVRDGVVTDCGSSNVCTVKDGVLLTHPADEFILAGVTRGVVLRLARDAGISVKEEAFTAEDLADADEIFITSTTSEVLPVTKLDGVLVGDGKPGAVSKQLWEAFDREVQRVKAS